MKISKHFLNISLIVLLMIQGCGQDNLKQKELELKERELTLKEKELELKLKGSNTNKSNENNNLYDYSKHSDFKVFWIDFKKAVIKKDKKAVTKMTYFPFTDKYEHTYKIYGGGTSRSAATASKFNAVYDRIFTSNVILAIKNDKYRGHIKDTDYEFPDQIRDGEFLLEAGGNLENNLVFTKKNGKYKLTYICFYP